MFCPNCGNQLADDANFCGMCGTAISNAAENKVLHYLRDKLSASNFTLATVLFTISKVLTLLGCIFGNNFSVSLLGVIIVIALWSINSALKSNKPLTAYIGPIKTIRIVLKIKCIINWVAGGISAIAGLMFIGLGIAGGNVGIKYILDEFGFSYNTDSSFTSSIYTNDISAEALIVWGIFFLIITAIVVFVNIFPLGSLIKCIRSFEQSAKTGVLMISKRGAARGWLIFMGIITGIFAILLISMAYFIPITDFLFGCNASVCIMASTLLFARVLKKDEILVDKF